MYIFHFASRGCSGFALVGWHGAWHIQHWIFCTTKAREVFSFTYSIRVGFYWFMRRRRKAFRLVDIEAAHKIPSFDR